MTYAQQLARERLLRQAAQNAANDTMVQVKADIRVQRALWLACVAMNNAFAIGPGRFPVYAECLQRRSDWYEELVAGGDEEYADEKLRQEAERCSGMKIGYLYETEIRKAKQYLEENPGTNYDRIRMMTVEQMARFIVDEVLGLGEEREESAEGAWLKWLEEEARPDEQRGD